mmetsp:Transcript_56880/g.148061  ORF Transcript_56880/g.148061 Transcript_56880/m.148061 type:complete len:83 (+) Transcript_56880:178-426(+)
MPDSGGGGGSGGYVAMLGVGLVLLAVAELGRKVKRDRAMVNEQARRADERAARAAQRDEERREREARGKGRGKGGRGGRRPG